MFQIFINCEEKRDENNSVLEYIHQLFLLTSRIDLNAFQEVNHDLIKRIVQFIPKLVDVRIASIYEYTFTENLQ